MNEDILPHKASLKTPPHKGHNTMTMTHDLRIQAVNAAKEHLANLVPNAKKDLKELAFPDANGLEIQRPHRWALLLRIICSFDAFELIVCICFNLP